MNRNNDRHNLYSGHRRSLILLCLLGILVPSIVFGSQGLQRQGQSPLTTNDTLAIKPTIPSANRHTEGRVFLERADKLLMDEKVSTEYQVLIGNVQFRKGDMFMFCDSAHFYEASSSLNAFGNVRMEQGDTLFVYADELDYNGADELATFYGDDINPVRLINKDVELETYTFYYDIASNIGYYDNEGKITDAENQLTSGYGQYSPDTKDAEFREHVVLNDIEEKDFRMTTETLLYNTGTHIARIISPTTIVTDSATVYSSNGIYNTDMGFSELFDRSLIVTEGGNTLTGDTIYYDQKAGFGEAFGNMVLTDSVRQTMLEGNYGCYFEKQDSAFATNRARILEYSKGDTLYMHGDTIRSYVLHDDSTHVMTAYPRVRFWRVDIQGLCDSLSFMERDSTLYMHRHPIVWNEARQIFGNVIYVHFNDSTVDWAKLPEFGFTAEHVGEEFYNQLSGKEMLATFVDGNMRRLDVSGNVEVVLLPEESDSTINKIVNSESSFLTANFSAGPMQVERIKMWPDVTGTATPLYLAKKSIFYLSNFQWYEALRPKDKDDIFNIPPEMEALLNEPDPTVRKRRVD
ncbi:OstA-like protein [uncultured Muribaculum sp.]|uniref:OstA-like protein n=1 Tax=uncultured Muribaculum sp. TaxID=1918613 RepID=UPI00272AD30F|nr:OstA-like protein [uncultured Muribaculum sp.]